MANTQETITDPMLITATAAAIARWGLGGATIERIAAEAGLSRATMHRRGLTREALVAALTGQAAQELRAALWPAMTGSGTAASRLRAALDATFGVADRNLHLLSGLYSAGGEVFHYQGPGALTLDVFAEPFERLLRDGAADGTLRAVPPDATATVLFNLAGWGYVHLRAGHGWPAERARQSITSLVLDGLLPR